MFCFAKPWQQRACITAPLHCILNQDILYSKYKTQQKKTFYHESSKKIKHDHTKLKFLQPNFNAHFTKILVKTNEHTKLNFNDFWTPLSRLPTQGKHAERKWK
jgi:hypothetical protein